MSEETAKTSNQRSIQNVLINKPLQRELTCVLIGVMLIAGTLVGLLIHFTMKDILNVAPGVLSRGAFEQLILDARLELLLSCIFVMFMAVITTGFLGVIFLHRVAGPVYRFGVVLRHIAKGEIPHEISLRSKDFFKETAVDINGVILFLKLRSDKLQQIEEKVEKLAFSDAGNSVRHQLEDIHNHLKELRRSS